VDIEFLPHVHMHGYAHMQTYTAQRSNWRVVHWH
jgi:hypothetical protein